MILHVNIFHKRPVWAVLLILAAGIVAYSNTFHIPFLLDDHVWITLNNVVKHLDNFYANSSGYDTNSSRFIGFLTFALNYHFGGLNVSGYHLVNLVIHLITSLLVFFLLRLTFRTPYFLTEDINSSPQPSVLSPQFFIPLFAALLFVIHPVQTQAVSYIIQRTTSLMTMFYLLSAVLYVKARLSLEESRVRSKESSLFSLLTPHSSLLFSYVGSVLAAVLAMKTKENAITLPVALVLYEICFFRGPWKKRLLYLLPLLATLPIIPMTVFNMSGPTGDNIVSNVDVKTGGASPIARLAYLFTQFRVIVTYLRLLVLPVNQNLDYDYPLYTTFFTPPVFLSFLLLAAIFFLGIYLFYVSRLKFHSQPVSGSSQQSQPVRQADHLRDRFVPHSAFLYFRLVAFGIFWFFLTLSVESSLIPIADVIMEHRLYLPNFGAAATFATVFYLLGGKIARPAFRSLFAVGALVLVLVLGYATYQRNYVWGDDVRLWEDVATKSPNKARPYNNLGRALNDAGKPWEALPILMKSLSIAPYFDYALFNLGRSYFLIGQYEKAITFLKKAIQANPDFNGAYVDLGAVLIKAGKYEEAANFLEQNIERLKEFPQARFNLGVAYYNLGNLQAARRQLAILSQIDPGLANKLADLLP